MGEVLTARTSDIADADGMSNAEFGFNWGAGDYLRVTGVNETYRVQSRDVGLAISVSVGFRDDAGSSEILTSADTVAVAPTTAARPSPGIKSSGRRPRAAGTFLRMFQRRRSPELLTRSRG